MDEPLLLPALDLASSAPLDRGHPLIASAPVLHRRPGNVLAMRLSSLGRNRPHQPILATQIMAGKPTTNMMAG
jgi:hypothetical protein